MIFLIKSCWLLDIPEKIFQNQRKLILWKARPRNMAGFFILQIPLQAQANHLGFFIFWIAMETKTKNSDGYKSALQVATGPALLSSISGRNGSAGTKYVQIHDAASAPADGTKPVVCMAVAAGANYDYRPPIARPFTTGIYVCSSTADETKTLSGTADITVDAILIPKNN